MGAEAPAFAGSTMVIERPLPQEAGTLMEEMNFDLPMLHEIPPPSRRELAAGPFGYIVKHEIGHWLVAEAMGESVEAISFVPQGDSLARTIMSGHSSSEAAAIIAAAGGIYGMFGTAGDKAQVEAFSGQSFSSKVGEARAQLYARYEPRVIQKVNDIAMHIGKGATLHRLQLQKILRQAILEVEIEKRYPHYPLDMLWKDSKWKWAELERRDRLQNGTPEIFQIPQKGDWTVIVETPEGILVKYYRDGEEIPPCPFCPRRDPHIHNLDNNRLEGDAPIVESPELQVIFQDPPQE